MRDEFGYNFAMNIEEPKETTPKEEMKFKGIHISTNGYYGYQLIQSNQTPEEEHEFMDVQYNNNPDSDIQFNNFIRPEDRLCSDSSIIREPVNRKRRLNDVTTDCKKRRENEPDSELHRISKLNSRQPTHNVPDYPRNLMGHFI